MKREHPIMESLVNQLRCRLRFSFIYSIVTVMDFHCAPIDRPKLSPKKADKAIFVWHTWWWSGHPTNTFHAKSTQLFKFHFFFSSRSDRGKKRVKYLAHSLLSQQSRKEPPGSERRRNRWKRCLCNIREFKYFLLFFHPTRPFFYSGQARQPWTFVNRLSGQRTTKSAACGRVHLLLWRWAQGDLGTKECRRI